MRESYYLAPLSAGRLLSSGDTRYDDPKTLWLNLLGRRKDDVGLAQVRAELDVIAAQIDQQQPGRTTALTIERATDAMATRMLLAQGARQLGVGTLVAAPILAVVGAVSTHFFPLGSAVTVSAGVLVSVTIIAVVLAATWLPTRKVLRVALRDALWRE